jgi:hypothetical protein
MQTAEEREQLTKQESSSTAASAERSRRGYTAMIVSFSDTARVEQGWTDNVRDLRRAVENIKPTNRPTLINEALQVAAGLANPGRSEYTDNRAVESQPAKMFILSDGKFPPVQGFSLGNLNPVFLPIGQPDAANLGIVSFTVRRNEDREGQLQAFGSIQNFGDEAVKAPVDLLLNGNPLDASEVTVPPGDAAGVSFNLGEIDSGIVEMRLTRNDVLSTDNRAWAAVNSSRKPKVLLVTTGNEALEFALATTRAGELADVSKAKPEVLGTKGHQKAADSGAFDLIIYDRCKPTQLPRANTLFIGEAPPASEGEAALINKESTTDANQAKDAPAAKAEATAKTETAAAPAIKWWSLGDPVVYPQIIDLDRTHPLMQWLDMGDVDIAEARPITPPSGATRLLDSNKGTLLAIAPREGFEDAVLGFDIYSADSAGDRVPNTNWPIRRSFPAFVFAVLSYLGGNQGAQAGETVKPGQPVVLKSDAPVEQLDVIAPKGNKLTAIRGQAGSFHFSQTDELGPYEVREGDKTIERFTVNLFDPLESDIRPAKEKSIQIGNVSVQGDSGYEPIRQETWKWLLVLALVVLLVEWYIYNRRVYI